MGLWRLKNINYVEDPMKTYGVIEQVLYWLSRRVEYNNYNTNWGWLYYYVGTA